MPLDEGAGGGVEEAFFSMVWPALRNWVSVVAAFVGRDEGDVDIAFEHLLVFEDLEHDLGDFLILRDGVEGAADDEGGGIAAALAKATAAWRSAVLVMRLTWLVPVLADGGGDLAGGG